HEPATGQPRELEERAPAHLGRRQRPPAGAGLGGTHDLVQGRIGREVRFEAGGHALSPGFSLRSAAAWMAWRIRGYVPQRQMFPDIAASISASVGLGLLFRSAAALISCPAWQ